jgi:glycosyltransferase involved in cell wall biosynthesis
MALLLSQRGFKVLYVESLGLREVTVKSSDIGRIFRRLMRFFSGIKNVGPNIWVLSPIVLPWHRFSIVRQINSVALPLQVKFAMWWFKFKNPFAWTYNPLVLDLLKTLGFKFIVYHCVDDLAAAPRLPRETIEIEERRLLDAANVVFVTSEVLRKKAEPLTRGLLRYYPNVADFDHFKQARSPQTFIPDDLLSISKPRIGFVGAVSGYKVDFALISEAARMRPNWHWILIGQVGEGDPHTDITQLNLPNVHLFGSRSYADLPGYLKGMDVTVLPCVLNDYTASMFPMKFFEYLAAGKVVIATNLPSLEPHRSIFVVANTAQEFVDSLEKVFSGEIKFNEEMDQAARENTWQLRLDRMLTDVERVRELQ